MPISNYINWYLIKYVKIAYGYDDQPEVVRMLHINLTVLNDMK